MKTNSSVSKSRSSLIACIILAVLVCIVFGQIITFDFVNFDDGPYVYANPHIANGVTLDGLKWILTNPHSANWHPLTSLSHMLDCQLYGLNPFGPHLTNFVLHLASVLSLFLVLRSMTGSFWRSAVVAALFAIHPLRAESVAWVSERKDLLSGLLFILTLGAYLRYTRRSFSLCYYIPVLVLFACGLLSKSMLVTLPFVLLLLDFWPLNRFSSEKAGKLILEKMPLLLLAALFCGITVWAQRGAIATANAFPLLWRIENAVISYVVYIRQLFLPLRLTALYPVRDGLFPLWQVAGAMAFMGSVTVIAVRKLKTCPGFFMGWFWYAGMLVPVIGILQVGTQAHADRYTYLPQIGLVIAIVWLAGEWAVSRRRQLAVAILTAGILASLTVAARIQTTTWRDGSALWSRVLAQNDNNPIAHSNFGALLLIEGKTDQAIEHFEKSIRQSPGRAEVYNNLASAYADQERYLEAAKTADIALELARKQCAPEVVDAIRTRYEEYRSHLAR